jgi:hypothetical protein
MRAICQPIAMTSNRLTQGGKTLLTVVSALLPSALEKSVQLALVIMSCQVGVPTYTSI